MAFIIFASLFNIMKNFCRLCVSVTLMIMIMTSCKSGQGNKEELISSDVVDNPISAKGDTSTSGLPKIVFENDMHDFGSIREGETVSFGFKFKNKGKSDLLISGVNSSCGCTVSDYPKEIIKHEEEGVITVTFKSEGRQGMQNKVVTVLSNTQPNIHTLTIKAMVIPAKQ